MLWVVGGPNGAGKTTFAEPHAKQLGCSYLGADAVAYEMAPDAPETVARAAGREFLVRLHRGVERGESLVVESTLSGVTFAREIVRAQERGHAVYMLFFVLSSAEACIARVAQRVRKGGHFVPDDDVRRRFDRSLRNIEDRYRPLAEEWWQVDNSGVVPVLLASGPDRDSDDGCTLMETVRRAVEAARAKCRRLGVPNVHFVDGRPRWEPPDEDPQPKA